MKAPNRYILFRVKEECNIDNAGEMLTKISEIKNKFNKLLLKFYDQHPSVKRTVEQLEEKDIGFGTYSDYYETWSTFEVNISFENVNYTEELKRYNKKMQEKKEQSAKTRVQNKAKKAVLNKANELLKNLDKDKIEKIIESLNKE